MELQYSNRYGGYGRSKFPGKHPKHWRSSRPRWQLLRCWLRSPACPDCRSRSGNCTLSASLTEFHDDVEGIAFLRKFVPDSNNPKIGSRENLQKVPKFPPEISNRPFHGISCHSIFWLWSSLSVKPIISWEAFWKIMGLSFSLWSPPIPLDGPGRSRGIGRWSLSRFNPRWHPNNKG